MGSPDACPSERKTGVFTQIMMTSATPKCSTEIEDPHSIAICYNAALIPRSYLLVDTLSALPASGVNGIIFIVSCEIAALPCCYLDTNHSVTE
jgi:hypothetical protein